MATGNSGRDRYEVAHTTGKAHEPPSPCQPPATAFNLCHLFLGSSSLYVCITGDLFHLLEFVRCASGAHATSYPSENPCSPSFHHRMWTICGMDPSYGGNAYVWVRCLTSHPDLGVEAVRFPIFSKLDKIV